MNGVSGGQRTIAPLARYSPLPTTDAAGVPKLSRQSGLGQRV